MTSERVQLRVSSIVDAVEQSLRELILDQDIPSGTAVKETDVARRFDVARPTAKAAIERLVSTGLLRRDAHKSARVPILSPDDVSDLYVTRSLIESSVCQLLAELHRLPHAASASIERMRALPSDALPGQIVEPDIAFHTSLATEVGIARLTRIHGALMQEMHLCMAQVQAHHLIAPSMIIAEHQAIVDAIASGDGDAASRSLRSHLAHARVALVEHLKASSR